MLVGQWREFSDWINTLPNRIDIGMEKATYKISIAFKKYWQTGIRNKVFKLKENRPLTLLVKQSTTPLIDHGDLIANIKVHRLERHYFFVGIRKGAKRKKNGMDLVSVAEILEYGSGPIKPHGHPYLAIPLTRKASRAGSPLNFPGKLHFVGITKSKSEEYISRGFESDALFIDDGGTPQYLLTHEISGIPPRPALKRAFDSFYKIAEKMWEEELRRIVYGHV